MFLLVEIKRLTISYNRKKGTDNLKSRPLMDCSKLVMFVVNEQPRVYTRNVLKQKQQVCICGESELVSLISFAKNKAFIGALLEIIRWPLKIVAKTMAISFLRA